METVQHDDAPLAQLRLTTKELLNKLNPSGKPSGKSDYYEKGSRWQIDYGVGASRGQATAKVAGPRYYLHLYQRILHMCWIWIESIEYIDLEETNTFSLYKANE